MNLKLELQNEVSYTLESINKKEHKPGTFNLSTLRLYLSLSYVASIPMNGVNIPIGRNWTMSQIISILLCGFFLLEILLVKRRILVSKRVAVTLLLLIIAIIVSYINAPDIRHVLYVNTNFPLSRYSSISFWYILWLIQNIITLVLIYNSIESVSEFYLVLKILFISSIVCAVYGFFQFLLVSLLGSGAEGLIYVFKPEYLWGPEAIRIPSLEREPLYYAFYLAGIIFIALSSFKDIELPFSKKWINAALILNGIVFILGKSTTGFFSIVVAALYFNRKMFTLKRYIVIKKVLLNFFIAVAVIGIFLGYFFINSHRIVRRISVMTGANDNYMRLKSAVEAFNLFDYYPWTGVGVGKSPYFVSTTIVGNMYQQVILETGLIGFAALILFFLVIWRLSGKLKIYKNGFRAFFISIGIQWLGFYNFNLPSVWMFFCLLLVAVKLKR